MKCQINAKLLYGRHVRSVQFLQMTPLGNHLVNVLMKLMKMSRLNINNNKHNSRIHQCDTLNENLTFRPLHRENKFSVKNVAYTVHVHL